MLTFGINAKLNLLFMKADNGPEFLRKRSKNTRKAMGKADNYQRCPRCNAVNDPGIKLPDQCWHCEVQRLSGKQVERIKKLLRFNIEKNLWELNDEQSGKD